MDVHVRIETQPVGAEVWDEVLDTLLDEFEGAGALGVVGHGHGTRAGALFDVVADLPSAGAEALRLVREVFEEVAAATGTRLELARLELAPSDAHELEFLGASDVARVLGISRQRVYQLLAGQDFPQPVASPRRGQLWSSDDLRDWAVAHGRELIDA